jgi:hypothetical protein
MVTKICESGTDGAYSRIGRADGSCTWFWFPNGLKSVVTVFVEATPLFYRHMIIAFVSRNELKEYLILNNVTTS